MPPLIIIPPTARRPIPTIPPAPAAVHILLLLRLWRAIVHALRLAVAGAAIIVVVVVAVVGLRGPVRAVGRGGAGVLWRGARVRGGVGEAAVGIVGGGGGGGGGEGGAGVVVRLGGVGWRGGGVLRGGC